MRSCRIRKMPHHLRRVRGLYQVQYAVPRPLREAVAQINGKELTRKEREAGRTVPEQDWLIKSTSTGNLREAERIRDDAIMPEFRQILKTARGEIERENGAAERAIVVAAEMHTMNERLNASKAAQQRQFLAYRLSDDTGANGPVDYETIIEAWRNQHNLDEKDKAAQQMMGRWRRFFGWLVAERAYPRDCRDIARVKRDDLEAYKEHLFALMASGKSEIKTSKTVEDYLRKLTGLLRYATEKNKITTNPAAGFVVPKGKTAPQDKYQDFTRAEVQLILTRACEASPEIKWPMWLAAYSGGRLAEIVEAQTHDIEVVEDGTVVFHIRRLYRPGKQATLKTGEISERPVPLHDAVLREGFLAYADSIRRLHGGDGPLFPQFRLWRGRRNTDASQRLNAWLDEIGIKHPRKVFHSWRHTIKTRFRETDAEGNHYIEREDVADKLTGHAGGTIGRTYGYFPIPVLRRAISRVPAWPI
jgi:hypothetical protein